MDPLLIVYIGILSNRGEIGYIEIRKMRINFCN